MMFTAICVAVFFPHSALAFGFRIAKDDFRLLAMEIQCAPDCDFSDETAGIATDFGYAGEGKFADPTQVPGLNSNPRAPRIVVGFPEDRFDWARFTRTWPGTNSRLVVLNELTSSGKGRAFLSVWKPYKDSLEFSRLLPGHFSIPVGEISFASDPRPESGGVLLLLQGLGADAGINVQAFFAVRLRGQGQLQKTRTLINKSEIPVSEILARLNDGQPAEEVLDSTLRCELSKGPRGSALRCVKSRARIVYTRQGPQETPLGSETFTVDLAPGLSERR